jgi:hypothetical protein
MRGLSRLRGHLERVGHPAGTVGLKMSKLAQVLKQIAEDCRVVCHQRRRCHNRGFHRHPLSYVTVRRAFYFTITSSLLRNL